MEREKLYRYTGSMQQLAYVRSCLFQEGRSAGLRGLQVKNGPMQYLIMADKCLDIASLEYKGVQLSFLSKPGLNGRNQFDTHGEEALRSIMGGLFFTCGLENICAVYQKDGKEYPMHGRMRTTPAEHVCSDACWQGEEYVLKVSGEMREGELFGENLILRRSITSVYGRKTIHIRDEIENQGAQAQPMMLMYHCNMGYPFVDENLELILPAKSSRGREEWSQQHLDGWARMEVPRDGETEYVFLHELAEDAQGNTFAAAVNPKLQLGIRIDFNRKQMPHFMEWKSIASGDYVLGLEPSNSSVYGRKYHEEQGTLNMIQPFETKAVEWSFSILEGEEELEQARAQARQLLL
jgi:hypothetical protein